LMIKGKTKHMKKRKASKDFIKNLSIFVTDRCAGLAR
jgi:hypothetical protein